MRTRALQAASSKGSTADTLCRGAAPPPGSRMAASLERGLFARSFTSCEVIGRGGFGEVVKAWHAESQQWQAVKFVPIELMADQTVDDDSAWCGADLFDRLCTMNCPHVIRPFRRWTELTEDVRDSLPKDSGILSPTWSTESDEDDSNPMVQTKTSKTDWTLARRARSYANLGSDLDDESDGGFEWDRSSLDSRGTGGSALTAKDLPLAQHSPSTRFEAILVIQMELWDGKTLNSWLSHPQTRHGLVGGDTETALTLFAQLVAGLVELHDKGIVHRDVKPENVVVSRADGRLKLIDFGLSRWATGDVQERRDLAAQGDSTDEVTAVGTPGYAPPEQCRFPEATPVVQDASPYADVFSAGIILVEMLMAAVRGGPAWRTAMERASAMRALHEGYRAALPGELQRELPGWLRRLIMRMLCRDACARPSAHEVLNQLASGLSLRTKGSPYVGTLHAIATHPVSKTEPLAGTHNPYIGFFLDHAQR